MTGRVFVIASSTGPWKVLGGHGERFPEQIASNVAGVEIYYLVAQPSASVAPLLLPLSDRHPPSNRSPMCARIVRRIATVARKERAHCRALAHRLTAAIARASVCRITRVLSMY